ARAGGADARGRRSNERRDRIRARDRHRDREDAPAADVREARRPASRPGGLGRPRARHRVRDPADAGFCAPVGGSAPMRPLLVGGVAAAAALVITAGAAGAVTRGQIAAGRGVAGVTLGMTRTQVVHVLGRPAYQNSHGYMQFGTTTSPLFDVYLDVHS